MAFVLNVLFFLCCPFFCFHWMWCSACKSTYKRKDQISSGKKRSRFRKYWRRDARHRTDDDSGVSDRENIRLAVKGSEPEMCYMPRTCSDYDVCDDGVGKIESLIAEFGYPGAGERQQERFPQNASNKPSQVSVKDSNPKVQSATPSKMSAVAASSGSKAFEASESASYPQQVHSGQNLLSNGEDARAPRENMPQASTPTPGSVSALPGMSRDKVINYMLQVGKNLRQESQSVPHDQVCNLHSYGSWHQVPEIFKD